MIARATYNAYLKGEITLQEASARVVGRAFVRFEVEGEPVPKKRPRVVKGRTFTPRETVAYEEAIGWAFRQAYTGPLFEGPLRVSMWVSEANRRPQWQADWDNYAKTLDGLNGVAWTDDKQIEEQHTYVNRHAVSPGMVIEIEELAGHGRIGA